MMMRGRICTILIKKFLISATRVVMRVWPICGSWARVKCGVGEVGVGNCKVRGKLLGTQPAI